MGEADGRGFPTAQRRGPPITQNELLGVAAPREQVRRGGARPQPDDHAPRIEFVLPLVRARRPARPTELPVPPFDRPPSVAIEGLVRIAAAIPKQRRDVAPCAPRLL